MLVLLLYDYYFYRYKKLTPVTKFFFFTKTLQTFVSSLLLQVTLSISTIITAHYTYVYRKCVKKNESIDCFIFTIHMASSSTYFQVSYHDHDDNKIQEEK